MFEPRAAVPVARRPVAIALLFCFCAFTAGGCKKRHIQAVPPIIGSPPPQELPPLPPPDQKMPPPIPDVTPTPTVEPPPPKPAPSKPPATRPRTEPDSPKTAPPQISPQLSPEEHAEAERRSKEDIGVAERNLQVAWGKQLNTAQQDLVDKIRGFLGQAREAMRASDWVRARNLAQKAQVLSNELVKSL